MRFLAVFFVLLMPIAAFPSPLAASEPGNSPNVVLDEVGFGFGYASGELTISKDFFQIYPVYFRLGFDISRAVGLHGHDDRLQFSLDPFINPIDAGQSGYEAGLTVFLRYFRSLSQRTDLFAELGSGPMYLSISTSEQGDPGFNFLNQVGLGARYLISDRVAWMVSCRYRHLSHGGLRESRNLGLDSFGVVSGLSLLL